MSENDPRKKSTRTKWVRTGRTRTNGRPVFKKVEVPDHSSDPDYVPPPPENFGEDTNVLEEQGSEVSPTYPVPQPIEGEVPMPMDKKRPYRD